ncbi:RNA-binding 27 isoform X2 [Brachionus plicatilis]|uniref:RNA-binding 27 isoform X2 n=1 Tax=Brachionus plicatilis TaxID=10195 RepID=A0A3M7QI48_BRAPC|nr:RNA-binding 27 isoform X2 [Brachionus plicatilis]
MKIENQEALKKWLIKILNPIFEGDSDKLALYIVALAKKVENDEPSRQRCVEDLEVFLEPNTHSFVDRFFDALFSKAYLQADSGEVSTEKSGEDERKKDAEQRRDSKSQRSRLSRDYQEIDVSNRANRASSHSRRRKNRSRTRIHGVSRSSSSSSSSISPVRRSRSRSPYSRSRSRSPGQIVDKKQRGEMEQFEQDESGARSYAQSAQMSIKVQSTQYNNQYGNKRRVQLNKNGQPRYQKGANYSQRMSSVNMQTNLNDNVYTPSPIQTNPQGQSIQRQMASSNRPRNLVNIVTSGNEDETQDMSQQRGIKRTFNSNVKSTNESNNNSFNNNSVVFDVNSEQFSSQQVNSVQTQSQQHGLLPTPQYIPSSRNQGQFQPPTPQNCTLILRKIPSNLNTVDKMRQHFSKFGNIVDIQCHYDNLNDAALVQFSSNTEAFAAYKSPQPVFNNRFIRLFWLSSYLKQQQQQQQQHQHPHQQASTHSAPQSPAVGEPCQKKQLKDRLSFPGNTEAVAEGLNKENLAKPTPTSVTVSATGALTKTVFSSQLGSEAAKPEELAKKPASTETAESVAMAKKIQDENKKKALLLKLEVQKKARDLMEQQLKDQKILMSKLEQAKTVEEKTQILNLVKKLSEAIDKEKEILSKKIDALEIEGERRLSASQSPFTLGKSQKPSFVIPPVHQLKINNKRLNTTSFLKTGSNKLVNKSAPKAPAHQLTPASLYAYSRVSVDRRPKQLLFSGAENEQENNNIVSFIQMGEFKIENVEEKKDENNDTQKCLLISFVTRRDAEIAYAKCSKSLGKYCKNLSISWYKPIESASNAEDSPKEEKNGEEKSESEDPKEELVDETESKIENKENPEHDDSMISFLAEGKAEKNILELKQGQVTEEIKKTEENSDVFDSIFNDKE